MRELIAKLTASLMWEVGAFKVALDEPFKLVSGNFSPIYADCRTLISDAPSMDILTAFIHWLCVAENINFDIVAGGESAGIPFASFVAQRIAKPMVYVRKKAKEYGTKSLVEGHATSGATVLLVEDLITDGKSKLGFIEGLQEAGFGVTDCIVVFDRLQGGQALLAARDVRLHRLSDIEVALSVGLEIGSLSDRELQEVHKYIADAKAWHLQRGLIYNEGGR